MTILAAERFVDNADLILACRELGYVTDDDLVLDPTYGRGTWWKRWAPPKLIVSDLGFNGVDFRHLPWPDNTFDVVAYDPPYVATGTRSKSTLAKTANGDADYLDRYGLVHCPKTPEGVLELVCEGLTEVARVVRPGGKVLFKCMNYVSGGRYRTAAYDALAHARLVGFRLADEFVFLKASPGPQPGGRVQRTARRNYSHLFVLEKA